jgi:aspartyl-tRNA(Asn)/glutamyl-tRNA(Gln) amidotransferase subunit C
MSMLTKDQVRHVAKLANLPLTEEEEEKFSTQLSAVLEYIDKLNQVETKGVDPTYNTSGNVSVTREDEPTDSLTQDQATKNVSNTKDGFFVTKGVFTEE